MHLLIKVSLSSHTHIHSQSAIPCSCCAFLKSHGLRVCLTSVYALLLTDSGWREAVIQLRTHGQRAPNQTDSPGKGRNWCCYDQTHLWRKAVKWRADNCQLQHEGWRHYPHDLAAQGRLLSTLNLTYAQLAPCKRLLWASDWLQVSLGKRTR